MKTIYQDQIDKYLMDGQISAHVDILRKNGFPVTGVVLLAIGFNKLPTPGVTKTGKPLTCKEHHVAIEDCWQTHAKWEKYILTRDEYQLERWRRAVVDKAYGYMGALEEIRDVGIEDVIQSIPMEGVLHGTCAKCFYRTFCQSGRQVFDSFTIRDREPGIIHSGLRESE